MEIKVNPHSIDDSVVYFDRSNDTLYRKISDGKIQKYLADNRDLFFQISVNGNVVAQKKWYFPNNISVWCYEQLVDYGKFMSDLSDSLRKNGLCLKDGHPYNTLFIDGKIAFLDHGSIVSGTNWKTNLKEQEIYRLVEKFFHIGTAYRLRHKLADMKSISKWEICKTGFWDFLSPDPFVKGKERARRAMSSKRSRKSQWSEYIPDIDSFHGGAKEQVLLKLINAKQVKTMVDFGCNTGIYSLLAHRENVDVLAMDLDESVLSIAYEYFKKHGLPITSVVADLELYGKVLGTTMKCLRPTKVDLFLAYAILHHLVHVSDYNFFTFFDRTEIFNPRNMLIEFVSYDDVHLKNSPNKKSWYSADTFCEVAYQYGYTPEALQEHDTGRKLIILERN